MNKLLFIRYRPSEKIDTGGEQGTDANYQALCRLLGKENISVYYVIKSAAKKNVFQMMSILLNFLKGYYYGLSAKKVNEISDKAVNENYSYVFIDRSLYGVIAKNLKMRKYNGKIITFFHNVESVYFKAKIGSYRPWRFIVTNCAWKNDRQSCDYSDIIIALNQRDQQEIENRYHRVPDILSPVVLKDKYNKNEYPQEDTRTVPVCLFIGTYVLINVKGILWFINEVLPNIDIHLQIAGKEMNAIIPKVKDNKKIEVFSDVPDLSALIEQADYMLLPIFEGSGMKVKTCESLMYGKNMIGTKEAFEGYQLDYEKAGACCNTKEEFIAALTKAKECPKKRFNSYSRNIFLNNYSIEQREKRFSEIFKDLSKN